MPEAESVAKSSAISGVRPAVWQRIGHWGWLGALVVAVLALVFVAARAQPKAQPHGDVAPVLAAEQALGAAMRAGDRTAARHLLSLQFSAIDADGKIHPRRDFLGNLKILAAGPGNGAKVRNFGRLALVTGERQSARGTSVFFLDIWAKQKGAWRVLVMQNVPLAESETPVSTAAVPDTPAKPYECKNPCQTIPYRVRSAAEQEIIATFQAIAKAIIVHDADEWAKHVADDFMLYASDQAPVSKPGRLAAINGEKESNAAVSPDEIEAMRLSVYGDAAAMIVTGAVPGKAQPSYRAVRLWLKRNGRWLMALSAHTDVK